MCVSISIDAMRNPGGCRSVELLQVPTYYFSTHGWALGAASLAVLSCLAAVPFAAASFAP